MIVTCPGCASKYRVRNEAVPAEGARMRCPKCETLFLAKPPAAGELSSDEIGPPTLVPPPPTTPPMRTPAPVTVPGAALPSSPSPPPGPFGGARSQPPTPAPFAAPAASTSTSLTALLEAPTPGASQPLPRAGGLGTGSQPVPRAGGPPTGSHPVVRAGGPPTGSQPVARAGGGPLTGMMQSFDSPTLGSGRSVPLGVPVPTPTLPGRPEEDPFAKVDINTTSPPSLSLARPPPPQRVTTSTAQSPGASPPVRVVRGPSMVGTVGSYAALFAAMAATVVGITVAGWTSEAMNLDAVLMPIAEKEFGVRPPRSFQGADDAPIAELRTIAAAKEASGDLAGAAVAWRRVQVRDDADKAAIAALPRVMSALGERRR